MFVDYGDVALTWITWHFHRILKYEDDDVVFFGHVGLVGSSLDHSGQTQV